MVSASAGAARARNERFNPLWVRLRSDEHEEFGMQRIALVEGRRQVELAPSSEPRRKRISRRRSALRWRRRGRGARYG